jgi:hypothetical protein
VLEGKKNIIEFTGKIYIFKRRITEKERVKMKREIIKVAKEISKDFTEFQCNFSPTK